VKIDPPRSAVHHCRRAGGNSQRTGRPVRGRACTAATTNAWDSGCNYSALVCRDSETRGSGRRRAPNPERGPTDHVEWVVRPDVDAASPSRGRRRPRPRSSIVPSSKARPGRRSPLRAARGRTRNSSPCALTSPRRCTSGPTDVPGRSRETMCFTTRSRPSFATVATKSAAASRNFRNSAAMIAAIGPTTMVPSC